MIAKTFKQWIAKERDASYHLTKKAIEKGLIPPANTLGCNRCKQKDGIVDYHNYDYSHPTEFLEALCYTCHMVLHNFHNNPQGCMDYWDRVFRGSQSTPVFKRREFFAVMRREGIFS